MEGNPILEITGSNKTLSQFLSWVENNFENENWPQEYKVSYLLDAVEFACYVNVRHVY